MASPKKSSKKKSSKKSSPKRKSSPKKVTSGNERGIESNMRRVFEFLKSKKSIPKSFRSGDDVLRNIPSLLDKQFEDLMKRVALITQHSKRKTVSHKDVELGSGKRIALDANPEKNKGVIARAVMKRYIKDKLADFALDQKISASSVSALQVIYEDILFRFIVAGVEYANSKGNKTLLEGDFETLLMIKKNLCT